MIVDIIDDIMAQFVILFYLLAYMMNFFHQLYPIVDAIGGRQMADLVAIQHYRRSQLHSDRRLLDMRHYTVGVGVCSRRVDDSRQDEYSLLECR